MNTVQPELWREFFITFGQSVAALLGLLFVANSLHLDKLHADPLLRRRAHNISLVMLFMFLQSLAVLIPQNRIALAVELFATNVPQFYLPLAVLVTMMRRKLAVPHWRISFGILCPLICMIGAVLVGFDIWWGMHVVAIASAILLFVIVTNAWAMMLGMWHTDFLKRNEQSGQPTSKAE